MRRLLYSQSLFDDREVNKTLFSLYETVINTEGVEIDVIDSINYSIEFYKSNLYFPSIDELFKEFPEFKFITDKFESSQAYKFYIRDKSTQFRNTLRQKLGVNYLNEKDLDERLLILDKIARLEREIITTESMLIESRDLDVKELYKLRKLKGEGLKTNIPNIDAITGGISSGKILTVFAPPKCFKTTFAINMAYLGVTTYDKPNNTLFITLEIPKDELMYKLLMRHSYKDKWTVNIRNILKGLLTDEEEIQLIKYKEEFEKAKKSELFFLGNEDLNIRSLMSFQEQMVDIIQTKEIKTIFLDYIQLFRNYRIRGYRDPYQLMNDVVGLLRVISVVYDVRIVLISQTNRRGSDRGSKTFGNFKLSDLAEINALERDSYYIISLYSDEELKNSNQIKYQLLAHRDGVAIEKPRFDFIIPEYFLIGKNDSYTFESMKKVDEKILNTKKDEGQEVVDFELFFD